MSYMTLYRKWRPNDFTQVKGQDAVVQTLKNQIIYNRIGHAYLFCGTRGTGKTSIAKLFAKAVNCEQPIDGNPCNCCPSCIAINAQTSLDVLEIDAASNNGVDNIREIREQVRYSPVSGRYKVYIIDEVHMLSAGAFNALLKTLEEPPSYVIFILATTEKHKVPVTILSRCQKYDFKRISTETIANHLADLMEKEGIDAEFKALSYIARAGDGSMRDALSLLDQCISFYLGQKLTYENVLNVLGAVDTSVFSQLLRSILQQDTSAVLKHIDDIMMEGRELSQFLNDFLWYLRNLLILKDQQGSEDSMDMSADNLRALKEETEMVETPVLLRYIRILSELSNQIRLGTQKRVLLEVGFIKLCKPQMEQDTDSLFDRIRVLEEKIERGIAIAPAGFTPGNGNVATDPRSGTVTAAQTDSPQETMQTLKERFSPAQASDLREIAGRWPQIVAHTMMPMTSNLKQAHIAVAENSSILQLVFDPTPRASMAKGYFERDNHKNLDQLSLIVAELTGKKVTFECTIQDPTHEGTTNFIDLSKIHQAIVFED